MFSQEQNLLSPEDEKSFRTISSVLNKGEGENKVNMLEVSHNDLSRLEPTVTAAIAAEKSVF